MSEVYMRNSEEMISNFSKKMYLMGLKICLFYEKNVVPYLWMMLKTENIDFFSLIKGT